MSVRVLFDATAVPADRGGVGRYVDDLLPPLSRTDVDLVVVAQRRDAPAIAAQVPNARVVAAPAAAGRRLVRLLWEQVGLPILARRVRADVVHSPHYTLPLLTALPVVVTLHDATFFSHPELHSTVKGRFFRIWTRVAARRAAALVVPSRATAREVARWTGADVALFHVAHHGVDLERFGPPSEQDCMRVRASLSIGDQDYVAFLGTLEPRKNVPALVAGWVEAMRNRQSPLALVLAGGRGWDDAVDGAVEAVPAHLTVVRPGYLPLEDLPAFFGAATVVAYPSLGEGFGLPVLEAMACGAAVLTTRELSLPEVGGDAVEYTATDAASIGVALAALIDDPGRRRSLKAAAVERAASFTWTAAAERHAEAYHSAQARHGAPAGPVRGRRDRRLS